MFDITMAYLLLGTGFLGIGAGMLGVFGMLREQSLLGDAISHAAFPGIVIVFLATHSKNPMLLLLGGFVAGIVGALAVSVITHFSSHKKDTALSIVLSVFFGLGMVLLSHAQKKPIAAQAVLTKFIYGNAATMMPHDLLMVSLVTTIVLISLYLFFRPFMLISFDPSYADIVGYRSMQWDIVLTLLHVTMIIIGLQTVGVILISTLLIAPAAAARQWVARLPALLLLAGFLGGFATVTGSLISRLPMRLPSGPVIVLILTIILVFSLFCAPYRGIIWQRVKR